ncbi:MAG: UTP--glucose-1-phosphate uridylyltransferase GalU [candidate division KSB1 bacterium]|nr:UTP--glucose-1-phosphate uridylyltransferase GalU [candidate division KSB1 bacterium]
MIKKAVIPAAGFGTRFLPVTKAQPKEMLPIVDTPTIQYVIEEAVASGIHDILIIIGKGKRAIEDHFDRSFELENELQEKSDLETLKVIRDIANMANIHYIRQKQLRGLGDAISYARQHVYNEPFAVLLGDTIVASRQPCIWQLMETFERFKASIIGVEEVPQEKISRYGIVKGKLIEEGLYLLEDLIEKPAPEEAPSNLAIGGRYILTPEIFNCIAETPVGKGGEVQLTDAIRILAKRQALYAYRFEGKRYDIGNKMDFLKTNVEFALKREEFREEFLEFLAEVVKNEKGKKWRYSGKNNT